MPKTVNIIVVVNKEYKTFGRQLVHSISKSDVAKASLYTPKQYEDSEHQIAGDQHVIFIGRNEVSNDFINLIEDKNNICGSIWGFDSTKAVIYLDEEASPDKETILNKLEEIKDRAKKERESLSNNNKNLIYYYLVIAWWPFLLGPALIYKFYTEKNEMEQLRYTLGLASFFQDGLKEFLPK